MNAQARNTHRKLIDAAHALIWANSYAHVSVEDICRKAGVRKGSFYHFFPTKSDLAAAALKDKWATGCATFDAILANPHGPRAQLRALCQEIARKQQEALEATGTVCGCPYATLGSEMSGDNQALRALSSEMSESFRGYFERLLKAAAKAGDIPARHLRETAREMHIYTIGAMMEARLTDSLAPVGPALYKALARISRLA